MNLSVQRTLCLVFSRVLACLVAASANAAVPNDRVTFTLSGQQPGHEYEVRWQSFLHPAWLSLGLIPATQPTLMVPLSPPVTCPAGADCYVCADARARRLGDSLSGPWLSDTPAGKSCNQFAVGPIVLPPPPVPVPIPDPEPDVIGPAIVTMSGDKVFIACDPARYTKAKTTGTGTKRIVTCLK